MIEKKGEDDLSVPAVRPAITAEEVLEHLLSLLVKIEKAEDIAAINVAAGLVRQTIEGVAGFPIG